MMKKMIFYNLLFWLLTLHVVYSNNESKDVISYQMIEVAKSNQKDWIVDNPFSYQGSYFAEEGAGRGSIQLYSYYNDKQKKIYFAGCVIFAEDMAVEPKITVLKNLEFSSKDKAITDGKIIIKPLIIRVGISKKWIEGLVYDGIFYPLKK